MNKNFIDFMKNYAGQKLAVAVSGGVDSVALLYWLVAIGADIVCLHVNHGLREAADSQPDGNLNALTGESESAVIDEHHEILAESEQRLVPGKLQHQPLYFCVYSSPSEIHSASSRA